MIDTVEKIHKVAEELEGFHGGKTSEQNEDELYYTDKFSTPLIQSPYHVVRTGTTSRLIDSPAEHIITANPQVFTEPRKSEAIPIQSAIKQARLYNHWLYQAKMNNPDPIKEFVKNLLRRGEAFYKVLLNEDWDKEDEEDLPIILLVPDPMIIFAHPAEKKGIPECVIVKYRRLAWTIKARWPDWKSKSGSKEVDWLEYWDKDVRYFEADGVSVLKGEIQKNIYGFVPFVHAYSGFGKTSPEGKPEALAVSLIRLARPTLLKECQLESNLDSIIHLYAHPNIDVYGETGDWEYSLIPGQAQNIPEGVTIEKDRGLAPPPELFAYLGSIKGEIDQFLPPVMQGLSHAGESGRAIDIKGAHSKYKYDTVIENTEKALATALDMGRQIMYKTPEMLPVTVSATVVKKGERVREEELIKKEDLKEKHWIEVKLAAADPIETDRKALLGRTLQSEGIIDWRTNLIKYQGYTRDEAEDIITQTLADQASLGDPMLKGLLARKAMEKLGMTEELEKIKQDEAKQREMMEQLSAQEAGGVGSQGGPPRTMNVQNPEAFRDADMILSQRGARRPPK